METRIGEDERRQLARMEIAKRLGVALDLALSTGMPSEAAFIAAVINVILTNQSNATLAKLQKQ